MSEVIVYIVKCIDGTFYTGITNNLLRRFKQHRTKKVSYTKNKLPILCVHTELHDTRKLAAKQERRIKNTGAQKYLIRKYGIGISNFLHL